MKKLPFLIILLAFKVQASMETAHSDGQIFGQTLQKSAADNIPCVDKKQVPGFQTDNPPQVSLDASGNFNSAINKELQASEAAQSLITSSKERQRYKLDVATDPLFKAPNGASAETILGIKEQAEKTEKDVPITVTCEEEGEDVTYECFEDRKVTPQVPLKISTLTINHIGFTEKKEAYYELIGGGKRSHHKRWELRYRRLGWTSSLPKDINEFRDVFCRNFVPVDVNTKTRYNINCSRIQNFKINIAHTESNGMFNMLTATPVINITLFHDTYEGEAKDEWLGCDAYEKMVEEGSCKYGERVLSKGPETRNINGHNIFREDWQYRQIYSCKMIKDECAALRAKGCYQMASKCKEIRQGRCWIFEQSYACPSGNVSRSQFQSSSSNPFCLSGNCQASSYKQNGEMLDVITRLNLLKQVQDDIRTQQVNGNFQIFKGQHKRCSRDCMSFKDCCGGMNGWGTGLHIAGCSAEEKELALLQEKKLCHKVGTYCAKKVLGKCVTKKTTFCCFSGKFARILQEQGRAQLNLNWGSIEAPNCRGFTVDELSHINFSNLDLREVFEEMMSKYRSSNLQALQQKTSQKIQENLQQLEQNVKQKENQRSGVMHERKENL